jgi:hypothetical protein
LTVSVEMNSRLPDGQAAYGQLEHLAFAAAEPPLRAGDRRLGWVTPSHGTHTREELFRGAALGQHAAGACRQGFEQDLIEGRRGERNDGGEREAAGRKGPPGREDLIHARHPDVDQDDVGAGLPNGGQRLLDGRHLARNLDPRPRPEDRAEPGPTQGIVVDDESAHPRGSRGPCHGGSRRRQCRDRDRKTDDSTVHEIGSARHLDAHRPGESRHVPLEPLGRTRQNAPDVLPVIGIGLCAQQLT